MKKKHYGTKEDYKLAKQLKDLGFPQEITPGSDRYFVISKCKEGWTVIMQMTQITNHSNYIKIPTLEELLEKIMKSSVVLDIRTVNSNSILGKITGKQLGSTWNIVKCSVNEKEIKMEGKVLRDVLSKLYIKLYKNK